MTHYLATTTLILPLDNYTTAPNIVFQIAEQTRITREKLLTQLTDINLFFCSETIDQADVPDIEQLAERRLDVVRGVYPNLTIDIVPTTAAGARHVFYSPTNPPEWVVGFTLVVKDSQGNVLGPNDNSNPFKVDVMSGMQAALSIHINLA